MEWHNLFQFLVVGIYGIAMLYWLSSLSYKFRYQADQFTHREKIVLTVILGFVVLSSVTYAIIYSINTTLITWSLVSLSESVRLLGIALAPLAMSYFVWCVKSLSVRYGTKLMVVNGQQFVSHAPRRTVRYPLYLALSGLFTTGFLISTNWTVGLISLFGVVIIILARQAETDLGLTQYFS